MTESRSTPASSQARRPTEAGGARVRLDQQVIELFDGTAHECGNGNWCGRCRGDIREEAFQWLRDLAQWDAPRNETLLEFRRWERHILHDRARGTDHDPDPESA